MNIKSKPKGIKRNLGAKFAPERSQRVFIFSIITEKRGV